MPVDTYQSKYVEKGINLVYNLGIWWICVNGFYECSPRKANPSWLQRLNMGSKYVHPVFHFEFEFIVELGLITIINEFQKIVNDALDSRCFQADLCPF